jgi:hypothetical protein
MTRGDSVQCCGSMELSAGRLAQHSTCTWLTENHVAARVPRKKAALGGVKGGCAPRSDDEGS